MSELISELTVLLSCEHVFDEHDSDLNGADAECLRCGTLAGDAFPEPE